MFLHRSNDGFRQSLSILLLDYCLDGEGGRERGRERGGREGREGRREREGGKEREGGRRERREGGSMCM